MFVVRSNAIVMIYLACDAAYLGLLALNMSMGQWLCVPMVAAGIALLVWGRGREA